MPYVNIKLAGPEPTDEQKEQVIAEITEVMERVLGKKKERVMVMIETLSPQSIGIGGKSVKTITKESK